LLKDQKDPETVRNVSLLLAMVSSAFLIPFIPKFGRIYHETAFVLSWEVTSVYTH